MQYYVAVFFEGSDEWVGMAKGLTKSGALEYIDTFLRFFKNDPTYASHRRTGDFSYVIERRGLRSVVIDGGPLK